MTPEVLVKSDFGLRPREGQQVSLDKVVGHRRHGYPRAASSRHISLPDGQFTKTPGSFSRCRVPRECLADTPPAAFHSAHPSSSGESQLHVRFASPSFLNTLLGDVPLRAVYDGPFRISQGNTGSFWAPIEGVCLSAVREPLTGRNNHSGSCLWQIVLQPSGFG